MPVDSPHRSYRDAFTLWAKGRDTFAGSDAVKKRGISYLPMLEGHAGLTNTISLYDAYKMRALFYPAVSRTVAGLTGIVFGKQPTVDEVPESYRPMFDDVTQTGISLAGYGLQLCSEALIVGRAGTLVDFPRSEIPGITATGARPYCVMYDAESILNWHVERIAGKQVLTMVVLQEEVETFEDDPFVPVTTKQFRVLRLIDGKYVVQLWAEDPNRRGTYLAQEAWMPIRRGAPLGFIPFTFMGTTTLEPDIEHPPLQDLVEVDLSHYRTSADQEHGAHFVALPTPWISGHALAPGESVGLGPGNLLMLKETGKAGMLEFTGAGLKALAELKEEKRQLMATLGARMLETQKNAQESAEAIKLRHQGERSALSVLADVLGQHLSQVVRWTLFWAGVDEKLADKALVTINPDVMETLSAEDVKTLVMAWQAGAISKKTVYANLEWGEWTRPGITYEEEEEDIKKEGPDTSLDINNPNLPPVVDPNAPPQDPDAPPQQPVGEAA